MSNPTREGLGAGDRKYEGLSESDAAKVRRAKAIFNVLYSPKHMAAIDDIIEMVGELRAKHPDYNGCAMMHVLAGSGMFEPPKIADFEGEDSILDRMEALALKYRVEVKE